MEFRKNLLLIAFIWRSAYGASAGGMPVISPPEPPLVKLQATNRVLQYFLLNVQTGGGTNDFLLQESVDLKNWRPVVNVVSKPRAFRVTDWLSPTFPGAIRFYGALSPGQSPTNMLQNWRDLGYAKYQFRFQRTCMCNPTLLSGTVTVVAGKVVAVTDARDSGNAPISNPDLGQFKSIEQLLEMIPTESAKADLLTVTYDESLYFPRRIYIDYYIDIVDDEIWYEASAVQRVQ